ncbi:MAG TPA: LacI family transcriptional regulator [Bacteroidetes bacterium]|nr:LacI family transcriptional regulator [Bacteroidota bacterium]
MKKKTSLADIAKALGVSKTLVSMVLNGKGNDNGINEDTQKKVWAKAKELNYKPNMMARSLRMGKSNTIGLIVADISNSFYARMCRAVEDAASKKNYYVLFGSSDENAEKERSLIQMLRDRQVDGLIISTTLANNVDLEELKKENFPFVLVDRYVPKSDMPFVTADNYGGSVTIVEHLIKQGVKQIGQLTISPSHLTSITERTRGYQDALEKNGIDFNADLVREIPYDKIRESIRKTVPELVGAPHHVKGLFVVNNNLATATLACIQDMGLRIPEDIAVVCFDDVDMFKFVNPPVTAVSQPIEQMGEEAVEILLEMIDEKTRTPKNPQRFLQTSMVVRQSCGSGKV